MPGSADRAAHETSIYSSGLISPRLGIFASCRERRGGHDDFYMRNWVAQGPRLWNRAGAPERVFGGAALAWRAAKAAAIGEAVERLCLADFDPANLLVAAVGACPEVPSDASCLRFFLREQYEAPGFPIPTPDFGRPLAWRRGWALVARRPAFMPASLVHLPYRLHADEPVLTDPSSVGTACARSPKQAAARAILELIERDAWTMTWEARAPAPPVADSALQSMPAARRGAGTGTGIRLRAFDLTHDVGVAVMLVFAESDDVPPALAIGTAADLDADRALDRAVTEAVTSWRSAAYLCRGAADMVGKAEPALAPRGKDIFRQHALFYARPERRRHVDFLLQTPLPPVAPAARTPRSSPDDLSELSARLGRSGHEVVLYDLTSPEIAGYGLHVVRAVSTTLIRPTLGVLRHLAHPRLLGVPQRAGRIARSVVAADLLRFTAPSP